MYNLHLMTLSEVECFVCQILMISVYSDLLT